MNLIEALKTTDYVYRKSKPNRIISGSLNLEMMDLTREDILAEDWEIDSISVTITRKDFDAAWKKVWPHDPQFMLERNQLAKELGL